MSRRGLYGRSALGVERSVGQSSGEIRVPVSLGVLGPACSGSDVNREEVRQDRGGQLRSEADEGGITTPAGSSPLPLKAVREHIGNNRPIRCSPTEMQSGRGIRFRPGRTAAEAWKLRDIAARRSRTESTSSDCARHPFRSCRRQPLFGWHATVPDTVGTPTERSLPRKGPRPLHRTGL
jgi:hypothetical protein